MNFSALEHLVVDALLRRVRVLAFCHVKVLSASLEDQQLARNAIRKLERNGLVESFTTDVVTLQLKAPMAIWSPGEDKPNTSSIAWLARSRFLKAAPCHQSVIIATKRAEQLLGGVGGELRQPNQLMHDLGTSSTYVAINERLPANSLWIGEDFLRRRYRNLGLRKIPDAAILVDGKLDLVIEFAGRDYGKAYLDRFHRHWEMKQISYEIW